MKIAEIYEILNKIASFEMQEKWDNSGILLGNLSTEISGKIYLSLDLDSDLVENAEPNSLFITHHPLIFAGLKFLDPAKFPGNLIYKMISKNISLISLHTNFDKCVLNKFVATEILKYKITDEREFLIFMDSPFENFNDLAHDIKAKFQISNLRVVKAKEKCHKIALCTGSGSELLSQIDVDCFLTGDLKYHTALESLENNINLIDLGHFESERYFGVSLAPFLQKFQNQIIITNSINPFTNL